MILYTVGQPDDRFERLSNVHFQMRKFNNNNNNNDNNSNGNDSDDD